MATKTTQFNLRLEPPLLDAAKNLAEVEGQSLSSIIRGLLIAWVDGRIAQYSTKETQGAD